MVSMLFNEKSHKEAGTSMQLFAVFITLSADLFFPGQSQRLYDRQCL